MRTKPCELRQACERLRRCCLLLWGLGERKSVHIVLISFLGGVVLYTATPDEAFIVANAGSFLEAPEDLGEDNLEDLEFEEPSTESASPSESSTASAISALVDQVSTFSIASLHPIQTVGMVMSEKSIAARGTLAATAGPGKSRPGFFGAPLAGERPGLIGTFYDLKQTRDRKPTSLTPDQYGEIVSEFAKRWSSEKLRKYFTAPTLLTSSQIFTPNIRADAAPKAFGVEKDVLPSMWVAWYRARVSPPKSGTYHFVGAGDDVLVVRFNGKTALDRCWFKSVGTGDFEPVATYAYDRSGSAGFAFPGGFAKGPGFEVRQGEYYDIDILIGEQPGGWFFASLLIEEEGVEYRKDSAGNPILPIFRVEEDSPIKGDHKFPPYMENGPVWKVRPGR